MYTFRNNYDMDSKLSNISLYIGPIAGLVLLLFIVAFAALLPKDIFLDTLLTHCFFNATKL